MIDLKFVVARILLSIGKKGSTMNLGHRRILPLVFMLLCLCANIAGCESAKAPERKNAESQPRITETADKESVKEIERLIEQLAISDKPAAMEPVYTPSIDTPRTDKRVIAFEAAKKLKTYGKAAFPFLLAHLDDNRQSVAFRRVIPHTVGLSCLCIIEDQIIALPSDYQGSFYRKGKDGELHPRPRFMEPHLFTSKTIAQYLEDRKDKSLEEMQVEALEWLIEQEKKIGFQSEEQENEILGPLRRRLRQIKGKMGKN